MKKILLLAVFVVAWNRTLGADDRKFISSTSFSNTFSLAVASVTISDFEADVFSDTKGREVLRVDKDGDIFLRGKWIAWYERYHRVKSKNLVNKR